MHTIDLSKYSLRTDLLIENENYNNYQNNTKYIDKIKVELTTSINNKEHYTTISFDDVTDKDNFQKVEQVFITELKEYINKINLAKKDNVLIIGLGNEKSTPDSLGPKVIKQTLVTKHLYLLGDVDQHFQSTSAFAPSVTSITGIETSRAIKALIDTTESKLLIVVDSLAASSLTRLNKTIQITDTGIHPGSGVGNNRQALNKETLNVPVIAIGIPTVVDASTIVTDTFKYMQEQFSYKLDHINDAKEKLIINKDYRNTAELPDAIKKEVLGEVGVLTEKEFKQLIDEVLTPINYNLMVTPTEIDFLIERLALLIGTGINKTLHTGYDSTNNHSIIV